jgi:hypothetical protein
VLTPPSLRARRRARGGDTELRRNLAADAGELSAAERFGQLLPAGARLWPGRTIATALSGYPWTEWGWANCRGSGPVVSYNGAADGTPMPGGLAFARFMRELGAGSAMDPGRGPDIVRGCAR